MRGADGIRKKKQPVIDLSKRELPLEEPVSRSYLEEPPGPEILGIAAEDEPVLAEELKEEIEEESTDNEVIFTSPIFAKKRKRVFPWLITGAGGALLILVLLSTVFARLTLTLKPKVEGVTLRDTPAVFDISVARTLVSQRVLPAQKLEMSKKMTEEFEATGKKYIEERAHGSVKIFNSYSSSPQTLIQGTRLLADSGRIFRLAKTAIIPGAEINEGKIAPRFTEVEVVADVVGEEANVKDGTILRIPGFNGTPKYQGFYAVASGVFTDGFKGEAKIVSQEDIRRAQEELTKKIHQELQAEIARKIPPDFKFVEQLREIEISKIENPQPGTRLDRFPVSVQGTARILVFREEDVREVVEDIALKGEKDKELLPGTMSVQYRVQDLDFGKGRAQVTLGGDMKIKSKIFKEEFAAIVQGKKEGSIIEALRGRPELASFRVSFFPPWIFKAPGDSQKIKLTIEEP